MVTPVKFTREVRTRVHRITGEPGENRGVKRNELEIEYIVRASQGAVVLRLFIQMDTDVVLKMQGRYAAVEPRSVSGHFKHRLRDYWMESDSCDILEEETTVIVPDGLALLAPVLTWLLGGPTIMHTNLVYEQAAKRLYEQGPDRIAWENLLPSHRVFHTLNMQEAVEALIAVAQDRVDQDNGTFQIGPKS